MAMVAAASLSALPAVHLPQQGHVCAGLQRTRRAMTLNVRAASSAPRELGARDPFPAEIASNFGDKVIGNASTEHIILVPSMPLALVEKSCRQLPPDSAPMSEEDAKALLRKVVGWRLVKEQDCMRLQCELKLKNFGAGVELFSRIAAVSQAEDYYPTLYLEQGNRAKVEIWTHSIGGLSENDFILAAKIDRIDTSDLVKRNRVWA